MGGVSWRGRPGRVGVGVGVAKYQYKFWRPITAIREAATLRPGQRKSSWGPHDGNAVREFYAALEGPVVVGIEATGSMQWFLELLDELGIECRVGHPSKIRAAETRKQKHDRRDARLILDLLTSPVARSNLAAGNR